MTKTTVHSVPVVEVKPIPEVEEPTPEVEEPTPETPEVEKPTPETPGSEKPVSPVPEPSNPSQPQLPEQTVPKTPDPGPEQANMAGSLKALSLASLIPLVVLLF